MEMICTPALDRKQIKAVTQLEEECRSFDGTALSFPLEDQDLFLLLYDNDVLLSVLSGFFCEDSLCECMAYTHPAHRQKGHFKQLVEALADINPDADLTFTVSLACGSAMKVLQHMEAELWYEEYMMELPLSTSPGNRHSESVTDPIQIKASSNEAQLYHFIRNHDIIGSFRLMAHGSGAYFFGFEILEELRYQGLGTACFHTLTEAMKEHTLPFLPAADRLILQVSNDNLPAMALYQKAGFQITETMLCYLY